MKSTWPLQKAKNEFSRVVDRALNEGPQTVTRHGRPVVVVTAVGAAGGNRKATKDLLTLLRSCPADLSAILGRDRSAPRVVEL
jgi:prevent-host-death family protein